MSGASRSWSVLACTCALVVATDASAAQGTTGDEVRPPAVAGTFYPADAAKLGSAIDAFLASARPAGAGTPLAIVAPHAGYVFSAQIAADAFAQVADRRYDTVVLLGTNHTTPGFARVAAFRGSGFRTPLGVAPLDEEMTEALMRADADVVWNNEVHAGEHSVEVQVPFVQRLWPRARILPLIVGTPDSRLCERLGRALASVVAGRRVLVVASTDLSHYASARDAERVDRELLDAVETLNPGTIQLVARSSLAQEVPGLVTAACGEAPLLAAVHAARALGANRALVVSRATSADSPLGDRKKTVGYGAVVMGVDLVRPSGVEVSPSRPRDELTPEEGAELVTFTGRAIRQYIETGTVPLARTASRRLQQPQGAFVTLKKNGTLRGCVGRVASEGPLLWTAGIVGLAAAVQDARFPPVQASELASLEVEVAALSASRPIGGPAFIRLGRDGVVLEKAGRMGVFLPEVAAEEGWGQVELLDRLCEKVELPAGCWQSGARVSVFQTQKFYEAASR